MRIEKVTPTFSVPYATGPFSLLVNVIRSCLPYLCRYMQQPFEVDTQWDLNCKRPNCIDWNTEYLTYCWYLHNIRLSS